MEEKLDQFVVSTNEMFDKSVKKEEVGNLF